MRRRNVIPLLCLLPCFLLPSCLGEAPLTLEPPIQAEYLYTGSGKGPVKWYTFRLTLVNRRDQPMWFILPDWGEKPLPKDGIFPIDKYWQEKTFQGTRYPGEGGSAIEVKTFNWRNGFIVFRLPANGRLELDHYSVTVDSTSDLNEIVVLEAVELMVNGMTPLEKWLPYDTMCGESVKVGDTALKSGGNRVDWDTEKQERREDYPKEKVEEIIAKKVRSWTIKLDRKDQNKADK
jgi:hypothetical protein